MILYFLIQPTEVYSQDIGAAYWFKKGVNEKDQNKKFEYYQKAVQEDPEFAEAHYNLALTFMLRKNLIKQKMHLKMLSPLIPMPNWKQYPQ